MSNSLPLLAPVMAAAELVGAAAFVTLKRPLQRALLVCFGLGFAIAIAVADIIPDATRQYPLGWLLLAAGLMMGMGLMSQASKKSSGVGQSAAVMGMGLHNLSEGVVLAAAGPTASVLLVVSAIAHKMPEGVVTFSLTERLSTVWRWVLTVSLSLLIPVGAYLAIPASFQQPALALSAGMMLVVLVNSLMLCASDVSRRAASVMTVGGAIVAGLTCLVV